MILAMNAMSISSPREHEKYFKPVFLSPHTLLLVAIASLMMLTGCCCPNHYRIEEAPPSLPSCRVPVKPRVVLVLGGGGAKGLAHLGVLHEFQKACIPIDLIIGCSAGSLVGALYCDHPNPEYVMSVLEPMRTRKMLDINIWTARFGLSQGHSLQRVLKHNLSVKNFEDLKIPLLVVATDLCSGELVVIGGGPIAPAVQASCSLPFVFVPVELHGRVLVDGGVVDPIPARVARQLDAEFIIAVDLSSLLPKTFPTNLFGVAKRSAEITLLWQSETCLNTADIVLRPEVGHIGTFDDNCNRIIYEAGRAAARQAIPEILEKIAALRPKCELDQLTTVELKPLPPKTRVE